ncbi:pentapeptide repeat-containing protein [Paenibacillus sp. PL91]|uniref:pentapeptide repeat-containing protein n=1 Tax=Paenibacillus sp. PL91 TaxID=2729538 RepID=UPI00145DBAF4|nr:pentapeptide repeat-containing protein [Paenibacillus sp. PL91]
MERDVTKDEFLDMIQNGQRYFHKICVEVGIYHGVDFSRITFDECFFSVDFAGSNFENSTLMNSNFKTCDFSNCILKMQSWLAIHSMVQNSKGRL